MALNLKSSISLGHADFLKHVENPIAFNPNAALFDTAKSEGWKVVVERKNVAYEHQQKKGGKYQLEDAIFY